jgi:AAA+ ATPase superfamily predicted ATPase
MSESFFSIKTAYDEFFCNRVKEKALLKRNIEKGQHTVVVAPRRYGKTSLVNQVLSESSFTFVSIDLFCVVYANTVCEKIIHGISQLIKKNVPFTKKALLFMSDCFKNINVTVRAGAFELKAEFSKENFNPVAEITEALLGLEKLALHQKKKFVIFIDEFQDLLKADQTYEIQAAIRSVAQVSRHLCFIFSGSSRSMLKEIFEDRNQPLYMLCDTLQLDRISKEHFKNHLQTAAQKKWNKKIDEKILMAILEITECHSYYVNLLCDRLWEEKHVPSLETIEQEWNGCVAIQKDKLMADLSPLNKNHLKVLSKIALLTGVKEPNGRDFLEMVSMPLGTVQKAIAFLLDQDYLYWNQEKKLSLVDPLLKKFLCLQLS